MNSSETILLAELRQSVSLFWRHGAMRVKTAWDSSRRKTERWTQAECVPLERRSNLDIYRKLSLCLFFLTSGICFITAYLVFPSYASKKISMNLRGHEGVRPTSGHLSRGLGEIRSSVYLCPPPTSALLLPTSSPPLSSAILSLFLACFSAEGETGRSLTDSINGYLI